MDALEDIHKVVDPLAYIVVACHCSPCLTTFVVIASDIHRDCSTASFVASSEDSFDEKDMKPGEVVASECLILFLLVDLSCSFSVHHAWVLPELVEPTASDPFDQLPSFHEVDPFAPTFLDDMRAALLDLASFVDADIDAVVKHHQNRLQAYGY